LFEKLTLFNKKGGASLRREARTKASCGNDILRSFYEHSRRRYGKRTM
jgi:hypothetical protein